jgi:hypothetical protein
MPKPKLTHDQEVLAEYMSAATAAFQVLVQCLQQNGALARGQVPAALHEYMESTKDRNNPLMLAMLHDLRIALLD